MMILKMFIYIFMIAALMGCNHNTVVDAPEAPISADLVQWEWTTKFDQFENTQHNDPLLFKEWVLLFAYENNESLPFLSAYNKNTGNLDWTWEPSGIIKDKKAVNAKLKDNIAIINTKDGLIALNLDSRSILWEYIFEEEESWDYPFEITNNKVYYSTKLSTNGSASPFTFEANLLVFDLINGFKDTLYHSVTNSQTLGSPEFLPPAIFIDKNQHEIAVFQRGYLSPTLGPRELTPDLICYDNTTKEIVWQDSAFCDIVAGWNFPPIMHGEDVITIGDWSLYSYKAATGEFNWRTELESTKPLSGFLFTGPYLHNGVIYCVDDGGNIYAINAGDGSIKFTNSDPNTGGVVTGPAKAAQDNLLVEKGILFVNSWSEQALILFDANTGKEIERHEDEKYSGGNILYDDETDLFFITSRSSIKAFSIKE